MWEGRGNKNLGVDWLIDTGVYKQNNNFTSTGSDHWDYDYYFNYTRELTLKVIWSCTPAK